MGSCSLSLLSGCRYFETDALSTSIVSDHCRSVCSHRHPRIWFCNSILTSITFAGSTPQPRSSLASNVVHGSNVVPSECSSGAGCGAGKVYGTVVDVVGDPDSAADDVERTASPAVGVVQAAVTPTTVEVNATTAALLHAWRMRVNRELVPLESSGVVGFYCPDGHFGCHKSIREGVIVLLECF